MVEVVWFEIPMRAASKRRLAAWKRSGAMSEDGAVWLSPTACGRSEMEAMLCAGWDGTSVLQCKGHIYLPADWLKREYPDCADALDKTVADLRVSYAAAVEASHA